MTTEVKVGGVRGNELRDAGASRAGKGKGVILLWSLQKEPALRHLHLTR